MYDVWGNLPEVSFNVGNEFQHSKLLEGKEDLSF